MSIEFSFPGSVGEATAEESVVLEYTALSLYFNIDSGDLYPRFDVRTPLTRLDFTRGDKRKIRLYPVNEEQEDDEIIVLPDGAEILFEASPNFGGVNFLANTPWEKKTGADGFVYYQSIVDFGTDEINDAIGYGTGNELAKIELKADIEITDAGAPNSCRTVMIRIHNDIARAGGTPASPAGGIRRRGFTFAYWITGRVGGTAASLDGQATAGLAKGQCQVRIKINGKNEEFDWITDPDPGVTVADGVDIVKPTDYHAANNPGLFVRIA